MVQHGERVGPMGHSDEEVTIADFVMDRACTNCQLIKIIEVMWNERFEQ